MIIDDKKQALLEEVIDNFLSKYTWMDIRLINMSQEHRDAIGVLLDHHPQFLFHLKKIFDDNLTEDGSALKKENTWIVTREEATLLAALALPYEDDEIVFTNYKEQSKIMNAKGEYFDKTL